MKSQRNPNWPQRDMVVTDGQKLTLGDTTLTLYLTPGHTLGTISLLVPLKDSGKEYLAAMWGGTAFNFPRTQENFGTYSNSAQRFSDIVEKAVWTVVLTNHPDNSKVMEKIAALQTRPPGGSHPFVVGNESQKRFAPGSRRMRKSEPQPADGSGEKIGISFRSSGCCTAGPDAGILRVFSKFHVLFSLNDLNDWNGAQRWNVWNGFRLTSLVDGRYLVPKKGFLTRPA